MFNLKKIIGILKEEEITIFIFGKRKKDNKTMFDLKINPTMAKILVNLLSKK